MRNKKQKILLLYLKTAGGHLSTSKTLKDGLESNYGKNVEVLLVDCLAEAHEVTKKAVEDGYRFTQDKATWLFEVGYAINKIPIVSQQVAELVSHEIKKYLRKVIWRERPDKIVGLHFLTIKPLEEIMDEFGADIPVITMVTDPHTAPPCWFMGKRFHYVIFGPRVMKLALHRGIKRDNLSMFDYPVNPIYSKKMNHDQISKAKKRLGFSNEKKMVLILGGGDGIPRGTSIIRALLAKNMDAEIAIVCGKSEYLYKHARRLEKKYPRRLKVYGFVDFVYDLINISDVVVTKGGPATLYEILLLGKIPIMSTYIWEQEKGNMEFMVKNHIGFFEPNFLKLSNITKMALTNENMHESFKKNLKRVGIKNGTDDVAEFVYNYRSK